MFSYRYSDEDTIVQHILKPTTSRQSICAALKYYKANDGLDVCEKIIKAKHKAAVIKQLRKLEAL